MKFISERVIYLSAVEIKDKGYPLKLVSRCEQDKRSGIQQRENQHVNAYQYSWSTLSARLLSLKKEALLFEMKHKAN